jgi:hypothetical protein
MLEIFLKHHLLDLEVAVAVIIGAVAYFYFGFGRLGAVLLGASAFILIPLLIMCCAFLIVRRFRGPA